MHVVSVGEGNVDCDNPHNSVACGDALHPHETNGVLLLPESQNRWQAFNVHTLLLPQHAVAVSQQVSQSALDSALHYLAQKKSAVSTMLLLGVCVCVGIALVNMFGSSSEQNYDDQRSSEPETSGSWAQAYREAQGGRRAAMDLLFKTGIIATQDLSLPYVNSTYIEECVQVAAQMLKEGPLNDWVSNWEQAQQTFEDRLSAYYKGQAQDVMAAYEFSDGSWARGYRQSEGQQNRREAFELLLRLGIISPDEFANSLVTPKYIEERVSVAANLLKQKPLSQWVDLCETAHGNFKESVLACFATGAGGETPPRHASEWNDPVQQPTPEGHVKSMPVIDKYRRGISVEEMSASAEGAAIPGTGSFTTSGASSFRTHRDHPEAYTPYDSVHVSQSQVIAGPRGPPNEHHPSPRTQQAQTAFVLPVTPRQAVHSTSPIMGSQTLSQPGTDRGALSTVNWPPSGRTLSQSPRTETPSQGVPVKIMFSNNAISGSSWAKSVTPPGSQRDLR
jgi:hypothetical protein